MSLYCLLGALGSSPWAKGFPRLNKIPISHIHIPCYGLLADIIMFIYQSQ